MNRDTVGAGFATSGLTLAATHKFSKGTNILSSSYQAMGIDKTQWPVSLREKFPKELWMKSDVVVTLSQNSDGSQGEITFAADTWFVLPIEAVLSYGYIKAANATNVTEYYFIPS